MTGAFVAAALAAVIYFVLTSHSPSWPRSFVKTVPLAVFAALAWTQDAPVLLVAGFALSALGDLALSRAGERAFLAGLVSFALAHLCYTVVFVAAAHHWQVWPIAALVLLAASTEFWLSPKTGDLRWPVRIYVVLICAMGAAAFALPPALALATIGAVCFMASDIILSVQLFRLPPGGGAARVAGYALWGLYVGGQALILLAFLPGAGLS